MVDTTTTDLIPRELDYRSNDGIDVSLLWSQASGRLWVSVSDTRTDELFQLNVEPHNAVDVFNHPYAYAAQRGVEYREPVRV